MQLVWPALPYLHSYLDALQRGWSPDTMRGTPAADEERVAIAADPEAFVNSLVDREAQGGPIVLPDGSQVRRLPSYRRWIWDGEFCGSVGFRWQPGSDALPPHVLGHMGYAVVPWKRGRGHAKRALALLLDDARAQGLRRVQLATEPDNWASQRVITANGGVLLERFREPEAFGGGQALRFCIDL
jgi:predicted acetyltransferase